MSDFTIQFGRLVSYRGKEAKVVIPDDVTVIGRRAFYFNKQIQSVVLPVSVNEIEAEAFLYSGLKYIDIHGQIQKAGKDAFGALGCSSELKPQVYGKIPVKAFTKSNQFNSAEFFITNQDRSIFEPDIITKNIAFLGKNMFLRSPYGTETICSLLEENTSLLQTVLDAGAIPASKFDAVMEYAQKQNHPEFIAALMQCQGTVKIRRKNDALSNVSVSVSDWRKLFKFKYEEEGIAITGCKVQDVDVYVPAIIGNRPVKTIGRNAFCGREMMNRDTFLNDSESEVRRTITIEEGITTIQTGAFYVLNNMEIFLPHTVSSLPDGTFIAVRYLKVHVSDSVCEISDELVWDSPDQAVIIAAPAGSFAEQYAKKHNIPYVAE